MLSSEKKIGTEEKQKYRGEEVGGATQFISLGLDWLLDKARNKDGMIFTSSPVLTLYEMKYRRSEAKENCHSSLLKPLTASLILNNEQVFLNGFNLTQTDVLIIT